MTNFDIIRNDGRLLYEYIRGSHLYGLNNEDSDVDTSGVYVCTRDELFGCYGYKPQVSDTRHDNAWFEIAEGKGMILQRTWDRQLLMDVRNHKFEYEEIIERLEEEKAHMNQLMEQSTIRKNIDTDFVNQLMIDIRKKQLGLE